MRVLSLLGSLLLGLAAGKGAAQPVQGLMDYRWEARIVLVFAPAEDAPLLVAQRAVFDAAADGLAERDVVVHTVLPDHVTPDLGTLPQEDAAALRDRYDVAPDAFAAILVGKDGTEKLRTETVLMPLALFETIDAMPMRRREMHEGDGAAPDAGTGDADTAKP